MLKKEIEGRAKKLKEMRDIQLRDGNWNWDPYMHGMANGLIFAVSLMMDEEPKFIEPPEFWGYQVGAYPPKFPLATHVEVE
jgi:hypothetical protein|tara:strand:+ start:678 stop:920 length:243 start_codon:yes stop_codon:yes gene_type:complete